LHRHIKDAAQPDFAMVGFGMTAGRGILLGFIALYAVLFGAFGFTSPFLPAFLSARGLGPEQLGLVLGSATALRLVCGPIAGRLADRFQAHRAGLAISGAVAASATLFYFLADGVWMVSAVALLQAAALAPLVPLADALSLAHARPHGKNRGFEYGWVRGTGSGAFVAATLAAGYAVDGHGLSAIVWLSALALLAIPAAARLVPPFPGEPAAAPVADAARRPWLTLLHERAFVLVTVVAALVLGSHAMYDSFAVISWTRAGISPAIAGVLWAESVAAEVLVFLFLGPRLLRAIPSSGALALAAVCGAVRWGVLAQTADVLALGATQILHGATFALLHLAVMRIIADAVPRQLAATAQAVYGLVGVGGATAVLILLSGWLYGRFGAAGFWSMAALCMAALPVIWLLHRTLARNASSCGTR
jgi:MFS transporter, PPP family, 3-phenylpropionic acid transporter